MKPLILTWLLACGGDAASTHAALAHGAREVVFPTQNPWVIDGLVGMQAIGGANGLLWLNKRGHTRTARILGWTMVGVRVWATVNNLHQTTK